MAPSGMAFPGVATASLCQCMAKLLPRTAKNSLFGSSKLCVCVSVPENYLHALTAAAEDIMALPAAPWPLLHYQKVQNIAVCSCQKQHQHANHKPCKLLLTGPSSSQQLATVLGLLEEKPHSWHCCIWSAQRQIQHLLRLHEASAGNCCRMQHQGIVLPYELL